MKSITFLFILSLPLCSLSAQEPAVRYVQYAPAITTLTGDVIEETASAPRFIQQSGPVNSRMYVLRTPYLVRPQAGQVVVLGISEIRLQLSLAQSSKLLVGTRVTVTGTLHEELPADHRPVLSMRVTQLRVTP